MNWIIALRITYTKPVDNQHQMVPFSGKWIADAIPSLSSQSERAKNTIHWFGMY